MSKSNKNKPATAKFYIDPAKVEEVYSGYLHKSPGHSSVLRSQNSWKHRFFVLSKTDEDTYNLTYYSNEKRDNPLGEINLSKIGLMCIGVEKHQMWGWIQKHFNCPPASVLFLTVNDTQKQREYFLIGENSDVDCWHNALLKALKRDVRFRSTSEPVKCPEPKAEDHYNERQSAPELMEGHYDIPRNFSLPLLPEEHKISLKEDKDEKDGEQDESPEDSSEYMAMSSVQRGLEDVQQEANTTCTQTNETHSHVEDICISQDSLKNSLILIQEEGKPCVSECRQIQDSRLFHKGDQILAFNDLLIDTVEEIQTYIRRLSKDEVKLTIRRFLGSQPLHSEPCTSH